MELFTTFNRKLYIISFKERPRNNQRVLGNFAPENETSRGSSANRNAEVSNLVFTEG